MKPRGRAVIRAHAQALLSLWNADIGQNFYTLSPSQVVQVLEEADRVRYRKPASANGSRGRYYYQLVQRAASVA